MKKYSVLFAILALVLASLACQTLMGGGGDSTQVEPLPPVDNSGDAPTEESSDDSDFSFGGIDRPDPPLPNAARPAWIPICP